MWFNLYKCFINACLSIYTFSVASNFQCCIILMLSLTHVSMYAATLPSPFPYTCLYLPQHVDTPSSSHLTNQSAAEIHLEGPLPVSV